jgi:hypothetical protein
MTTSPLCAGLGTLRVNCPCALVVVASIQSWPRCETTSTLRAGTAVGVPQSVRFGSGLRAW